MRPLVEYGRQFGRFQRNARLYLINNALSGVTAGILLVLYNLYLISLGYGPDFVGLVLFVGTIGAGIAIFPAGLCVDRFSGKTILIWSNLLIGLAGLGQILFRQPIPLLVSGFIVGVGLAFTLVINAPFLTLNSTPEERSHLFSMNISLGLVTLVSGEVLGGALPGWFRSMPWLMAPLPSWATSILANQPDPRSYQLALLFAGIIAGPSLIPLFMLRNDGFHRRRNASSVSVGARVEGMAGEGLYGRPPSADTEGGRPQGSTPHPSSALAPTELGWGVSGVDERATAKSQTGMEGNERVTEKSERATARVSALPRPTPALTMMTSVKATLTASSMRKLLRSPFFFLALVYVLTGLGAGLFIPYFNIFFVQHLRASSALFGLIDGGANATTALFTLAAPWFAMRVGRIRTIALTRLLSIPLLLTIGLTGFLPLAALLYPFRQGTMDMGAGVLQVYSMEVVPERFRGLANSSYQAAFQVPWAITASLGGLIIVHLGYPPLFLLAACCYILTIVILLFRHL